MRNKILTIFCIFILLSLLLINNCYASDGIVISHNNQDVFLPALPSSNFDASTDLFFLCYVKGWAGYEKETYRYTIFKNLKSYIVDGYEFHIDTNGGDFFKLTLQKSGSTTIDISGSVTYYCYEYSDTNDVWELVSRTKHNIGVPMCWNEYSDVFSSNFDIYSNRRANAGLFFQQTPLVELELAPVVERINLTTEITTTITGLVGLLIPLLICLIGFWKGWHLLSNLLHRA